MIKLEESELESMTDECLFDLFAKVKAGCLFWEFRWSYKFKQSYIFGLFRVWG